MSSGNLAEDGLFVLSRSVNPAEHDAGRELLDHLVIGLNAQMTYHDVEMMKRLLQAKFSDESLIFAVLKIQETQPAPTLQQFWHFIHEFEGELTAENMNLRLEKDSNVRCCRVLLRELGNRNAKNNELINQNNNLTEKNTELTIKSSQQITEKIQLAATNEQLSLEIERLANENQKLKSEMRKKDLQTARMMHMVDRAGAKRS